MPRFAKASFFLLREPHLVVGSLTRATTTKPEKLYSLQRCPKSPLPRGRDDLNGMASEYNVSGFVILVQFACLYSGISPRSDDCSANAFSVSVRIFFTMPVHTGLVFDESQVGFATSAS